MQTKIPQPTQEEYFRRRDVLEDGFASGIFACYQFDFERIKRLQKHRLGVPLATSDHELLAQELAWKEIEVDIAVAKREAFKQGHSNQKFLPKSFTQNWITDTEPRLSNSEIEEVRPQFANTGMLRPDITIQVLYDPKVYKPKVSLGSTRQWQTVDFLWLGQELQKEAAARLEKFLQSQRPGRVTYHQATYLRQAVKPRAFLELWDHAVLIMHHWLKAWIFIYQHSEDASNLSAANKLFEEFIEREPIEGWHMECMERYWADGMVV